MKLYGISQKLSALARRLAASKLLRLELAAVLGLAVVVLYTTAAAVAEQRAIADRVLRLHIIAQSDSAEDQALKLLVRDRLLETGFGALADMGSAAEARAWAEAHLEEICAAAEQVLFENGCDLPVSASVTAETFPTRVYENVSLPAGDYTALKVTIGDGAGKNWWCVMFPPMCTSAAVFEELSETAVFTDGQWRMLTENAPDVTVRFKLLEWWSAIKELF